MIKLDFSVCLLLSLLFFYNFLSPSVLGADVTAPQTGAACIACANGGSCMGMFTPDNRAQVCPLPTGASINDSSCCPTSGYNGMDRWNCDLIDNSTTSYVCLGNGPPRWQALWALVFVCVGVGIIACICAGICYYVRVQRRKYEMMGVTAAGHINIANAPVGIFASWPTSGQTPITSASAQNQLPGTQVYSASNSQLTSPTNSTSSNLYSAPLLGGTTTSNGYGTSDSRS